MKRPWLLRLLPSVLKMPLFYRYYYHQHTKHSELFHHSNLYFCPEIQMKLDQHDVMHKAIAYTGIYELELTKKISKYSKKGGLFIDVGANYGYFSLIWLSGDKKNRVIAAEASPRNWKQLKYNIKLNHFSNRFELLDCAISRDNGVMYFDKGPSTQTGWGGFVLKPTTESIEVTVKTLDTVCKDIDCIDVLKIDVEGADTWVLEGAQKLLESRVIKHIFFEQNQQRMNALGIKREDAMKLLSKSGYKCEPLNAGQKEVTEYHAF